MLQLRAPRLAELCAEALSGIRSRAVNSYSAEVHSGLTVVLSLSGAALQKAIYSGGGVEARRAPEHYAVISEPGVCVL